MPLHYCEISAKKGEQIVTSKNLGPREANLGPREAVELQRAKRYILWRISKKLINLKSSPIIAEDNEDGTIDFIYMVDPYQAVSIGVLNFLDPINSEQFLESVAEEIWQGSQRKPLFQAKG